MVFAYPIISTSPSPFTNSLGIVSSAPTIIGIIVTFMFHSFFSSPARSTYLSLFSLSLILLCGLPGRQSPLFSRFSCFFFLFLLTIIRSSRRLRLEDPFVSQNHREVCASHSPGRVVCIPLVRMIKYKFPTKFPVYHLLHPVVSSLILSLC